MRAEQTMRAEPVEALGVHPSTGSGRIKALPRLDLCSVLPENSSGRRIRVAQLPCESVPDCATPSSSTMRLAISSDAVAAGDGALSTWTWRSARW
jgi:hypothetical protein